MEIFNAFKRLRGRSHRPVERAELHRAGPAGHLGRSASLQSSARLQHIPLHELSGELLRRITAGDFSSELTIDLGRQLHDALQVALNVYIHRMSQRYYRDVFSRLNTLIAAELVPIKGATVVDVGCGSINPYGVLFLFLMLGAQRGIAIDLDAIQDERRAIKALADCAAMMLLDPRALLGDYPIQRAEVLQHIASFDLARLQAGDPTGLDSSRLLFRREAVGQLSLGDGEADLVLSTSFLEHVENVEEVIGELGRITRIGGIGVHCIDGADHRRYGDPDCHPLHFLTEASGAAFVGGCNRIRPLDFVPLFERYGFEILEVAPFEILQTDVALQCRLVEPFRSLPPHVLDVVTAQLVVRRHAGSPCSTGVSTVVLAAGWSSLEIRRQSLSAVRELMRQKHYTEALDLLRQMSCKHPEYAQAMALCGRICHLMGDHEGAEREFASALQLPTLRPEAFLYRAWLRLEQNRSAEGLADALQARQLIQPDDPLETELSGVQALLYARAGQHSEAMALLDRLLQHAPARATVHIWRGWAFYIANEREQAHVEAQAALACDPNDREVHRLLEALQASGGVSAS